MFYSYSSVYANYNNKTANVALACFNRKIKIPVFLIVFEIKKKYICKNIEGHMYENGKQIHVKMH